MTTVTVGDVLFIPAGAVHPARNVGSGNAAELATYVVEKGKPILTLAAGTLLGQTMGLVAVTAGLFAVGAYLGRNLAYQWGWLGFITAFGCLIGVNIAAQRSEGLTVTLLFGFGVLIGLSVAPTFGYSASADPQAVWQAGGATALFIAGFGAAAGYATRRDLSALARILFWALIGLILFGIVATFVAIPNTALIYAVLGLVIFAGLTAFDFQRLRRSQDIRTAPLLAASIFLDILNVFLLLLSLFGRATTRWPALHPVQQRPEDPMPHPPERFAQHSRLSELVTALGFRRYPLFLTGLLYQEPGGPLRRAAAVASRDGDLVACDAGEVVEHAGRVPTSWLFDDDLTGRSPKTLVDALADRNQAFFAHEVAAWTRGRRSINEVGIALLHHWSSPAPRSSGWSRSRSPTPCWTSSAAWPTATSMAPWSSR
jgi:FtsH-binding integral membrane protein